MTHRRDIREEDELTVYLVGRAFQAEVLHRKQIGVLGNRKEARVAEGE